MKAYTVIHSSADNLQSCLDAADSHGLELVNVFAVEYTVVVVLKPKREKKKGDR
jgi:hypothetical protein